MHAPLPEYDPPNAQRASVAVGVAPILVLLGFTLVVGGLIDAETGFAVFVACTAWVVCEMHQYQRTIDGYNEDYVSSHLASRSSNSLREFAQSHAAHEPTRDFVGRFLDAQRVLLRDGQLR